MKRALFPGTFDPFTVGHYSIVERGLHFLDEIVVAIGVNESKRTFFTMEERVQMTQQIFQNNARVQVRTYDGLTIDFADEVEAAFILRGIRTANDFEYEKSIADMNRKMTGIETILLFTDLEHACISSTAVRDLLKYGRDVSSFIPQGMEIISK